MAGISSNVAPQLALVIRSGIVLPADDGCGNKTLMAAAAAAVDASVLLHCFRHFPALLGASSSAPRMKFPAFAAYFSILRWS